jgi:hypothetical protein
MQTLLTVLSSVALCCAVETAVYVNLTAVNSSSSLQQVAELPLRTSGVEPRRLGVSWEQEKHLLPEHQRHMVDSGYAGTPPHCDAWSAVLPLPCRDSSSGPASKTAIDPVVLFMTNGKPILLCMPFPIKPDVHIWAVAATQKLIELYDEVRPAVHVPHAAAASRLKMPLAASTVLSPDATSEPDKPAICVGIRGPGSVYFPVR